MEHILKKTLERLLRYFASRILNKYNPEVVAITGSVGKTSTRQAIFQVLSVSYAVRTNFKNYNNEIGIPLTIIGAETGGSSFWRWIIVFGKAVLLLLLTDKKYPNILILEMGADHPGDIAYLTGFVPIRVGVVTAIAAAHLEFFESIDQIAAEKGMLIWRLPKTGFAILNHDDPAVRQMAEKTDAEVITFGLLPGADVVAGGIIISHRVDANNISSIPGISFSVAYQGQSVPVALPNVLGEHLVYTVLAAIAVGLAYDLNLETICQTLKSFEPPKGRMHIIAGIKNTVIIDDTYNSSPLACRKALYQLSQMQTPDRGKKYVVLGDMRELGSYTEQAHQEIGRAAVEYGANYIVTVGEMARDIARGAISAGLSEDHCFSFADSVEAGLFLQQRIASNDIILVKGSQAVRMEKTVKEIMAEPNRAGELLVRQGREWK